MSNSTAPFSLTVNADGSFELLLPDSFDYCDEQLTEGVAAAVSHARSVVELAR